MSAPAKSRLRRAAALCLLAALLLGLAGYVQLFTTFMPHDDEGYVLWSARQFCAGKPLYAEVYSQYGPCFYAWYWVWHALTGLVFTSESARWLTLGYWLLAAGAGGYLTARLTQVWWIGLAGAALTFAALSEMVREPFHPGGFLAALAALGAAAGFLLVERRAARGFVISGALLGTAMALTKINVGAFFLLALGSWVVLGCGGSHWRQAMLSVIGLGVLAAPLALMKMHLADDWVQKFALVFSASGLAVLWQVWAVRPKAGFRWWVWSWMAGAGGLLAIGPALFCMATGTPAAQVWAAVVVAPLRHPGVIVYAILWRDGAVAAALLGLAVSLLDGVCRRRFAPWPAALALLRVIGSLAVLWQLTGWGGDLPFHAVFQFGPALLALMVIPLGAEANLPCQRGRVWLAWCAVWQILQAYPVAGSQVSWGCFLMAPLLVAGCYEGLCYLGARLPRPRVVALGAGALMMGLAVLAWSDLALPALIAFQRVEPLDLPGARHLHLPRRFAGQARVLSHNAALHGALLFSTPGMFSFNLWSERPTPTAANVTVWGSLLSPEQKQAILARLAQEPRAVVISRVTGPRLYNPDNFLEAYQPFVEVGDYTLWVRQGRKCLPLGLVHYDQGPGRRAALIFAAEATDHAIAGLQILAVERQQVLAHFNLEPGRRWRMTPVDLQAQPTGSTREITESFSLPGYALVQVEINTSLVGLNMDKIEAVFTDATGAAVQSFRFNKVGMEGELLPP